MKIHRILLLLLVFSLTLLAQESQIARKLDSAIEQQRSVIHRLERMGFWEINGEIKLLKKNLRSLRQIQLMINKLKESVGGSEIRKIREQKEQARAVYLRLCEIQLITRDSSWAQIQKQWYLLQNKNPEFLTTSDLAYYRDQLAKLGQELQKAEIAARQNYRKLLNETYLLYTKMREEPWCNRSVRWQRLSRSWEKTWERRQEEGLEAEPIFQELKAEMVQIEAAAQDQKEKAQQQTRQLYQKVKQLYDPLAKTHLATRDKKWVEYERRWMTVQEQDISTLAPEDIKKMQIELITLRQSLWDYKIELQGRLTAIFQEGQDLYDKLRNDSWAQSFEMHPQLMRTWEQQWQSKLELDLNDATPLQTLVAACQRLEANKERRRLQTQAEIGTIKENITKLIHRLAPIDLVKRDDAWFRTQSDWRQIEHVLLVNMDASKYDKYRQDLKNVYTNLLAIEVRAQKQLAALLHQARDRFAAMAGNDWINSISQWPAIAQEWKTGWAWKKELQFAESRALEKFLTRMASCQAHADEQQNYAVKQAQQLLANIDEQFTALATMGSRDRQWQDIERRRNLLHQSKLKTLGPASMQEFFKAAKQLENSLSISRQKLHAYCQKLLAQNQQNYDSLWQNRWNQISGNWQRLSQQWIAQRPLINEVSITHGPLLEKFAAEFSQLSRKLKRVRNNRIGAIEIHRNQFAEQYRSLESLPLLTENQDWAEVKQIWNKLQQSDYRKLGPQQSLNYQEQLNGISNKLQRMRQQAQNDLKRIWRDTRQLYANYRSNVWTRFLMDHGKLSQKWQEQWANKKSVTLRESGALLTFQSDLENCRPFWWRPLLPKQGLPNKGFLLDYREIEIKGTPLAPQWNANSSLLSFQTESQGQYAIKLLDVVTGQIKTVELYDPTLRWVSFPAWAPAPYRKLLAFCGRKSGNYDLYSIHYSRTQSPDPAAVTDTAEYEKNPQWQIRQGQLQLFFIRDKDIYCKVGENPEQLFLAASDCKLNRIDSLAVHQNNDVYYLAFCGDGSTDSAVYCAQVRFNDNKVVCEKVQRISELSGQHFAPRWSADGRWVVCYLQDARGIRISRIHAASGLESLIAANSTIALGKASEERYQGPEVFGTPARLICCPDESLPVILSLEKGQPMWQMPEGAAEAKLFRQAKHLSLAANGNYLAWTYLHPSQGRKLVVALVRLPQ